MAGSNHNGSRKLRALALRSALALTTTFLVAGTLTIIDAAPASAAILPDTVIDTIGGFNGAWGTAVNPVTDNLYVANINSNNVSVIDASTDSVTTTIPVYNSPYAVAVDPVTNFIYVPNFGSNNLSVINGATNAMVGSITTGSQPSNVAVDTATNMVYVTNAASGTVSVFSGASSTAGIGNTVATTVTVGSNPQGIAVDTATNTIYVANYGSNNVSIINGATNTVSSTVPVGTGPQGVGVDTQTNTIYVTNYGSNSLSIINGATATITVSIPVGSNPYGVTVDPENNMTYVANGGSNAVSVINGLANAVVDTINVGTSPRGLAVDPQTNFIYAANYGSNTVSVIAGATPAWNYPQTGPQLTVGTNPQAVAVNPNTDTAYVTNLFSSTISVINGATNAVTTTIYVPQVDPQEIAVDPVTNMIYVSYTYAAQITVINGATNAVTAAIGLPTSDTSGLAVNPHTNTIYAATSITNSVFVINGATNAVTTTIPISSGPQESLSGPTVAVNPVTNMVYATGSNGYVQVINGATNTYVTEVAAGGYEFPYAIAVDSANNMIYTANPNSGNVSVIDGQSNTLTDLISGWTSPEGIAVNPTTGTLYVSDASNNAQRVLVVDTATNQIVNSMPTALGSWGMAVNPNNNTAWVAEEGANTVQQLSWASQLSSYRFVGGARTSNVVFSQYTPSGAYPIAVAVNQMTNLGYVANQQADTAAVINGANNIWTTTVSSGNYPNGVAVDTTRNIWYLLNQGSLDAFSGQTNQLLWSTSLGSMYISSDAGGIAVDPSTNTIYTGSETYGAIQAVNGSTQSVSTFYTPTGATPWGLAFNRNTNMLYVGNIYACSSCGSADTIEVFNTATNSWVTTINLGTSAYMPTHVAVDSTTNMVYTANDASNTVSVINGANNTVVATIPVGTGPEGIAVDPITNTIYTANYSSDSISVIDGSTNTVVATINTGSGFEPDAIAVNPRTNTVWIAQPNAYAPAMSIFSGRLIPTTVSAISASANPQYVGMPVTYSATVSPAPEFATMDFTSDGTTIPGCGYVPINKSTGTASCTTTYTTPGTYSVVANNSGDINYAPSTSPTLSEVISQIPTATSLSSSANPVLSDNLVTYTATVSPTVSGAPTPTTGTVSFSDNGTQINGCTAQSLNSSGQATCELPYAAPGSHAIVASYSGSADYLSSTSGTLTETITSPVVSAPTLSAGSASLSVGQSTTLTATSPSEPNGTSIAMNIPSGVTGSGASGCYTTTGGAMTCSENVTSNTAGTYNFSATANLAGNMVPDSSLKYATYPNDPTWTAYGGATIGGSTGWNIINPGAGSAAWTYTGGPSGSYEGTDSQAIQVIAGDTYTLSATVNPSVIISGQFSIGVQSSPGSMGSYGWIQWGTGAANRGYSSQVVIPSGVTTAYLQVAAASATVTSGSAFQISDIQLTQTGSVQPYAPGAITASSATSNSVSISWTQPLTPPVVSASPTSQTVANSVTITAVGTNEGSGVTIGFNNPANVSQVSQNCTTSGSTITCTEQVTTTVAGTYDFSATAYPPPGVSVSPDISNIVGVTWNQPNPPSGYEFMPTSMITSTTGPPSGSTPRVALRAQIQRT